MGKKNGKRNGNGGRHGPERRPTADGGAMVRWRDVPAQVVHKVKQSPRVRRAAAHVKGWQPKAAALGLAGGASVAAVSSAANGVVGLLGGEIPGWISLALTAGTAVGAMAATGGTQQFFIGALGTSVASLASVAVQKIVKKVAQGQGGGAATDAAKKLDEARKQAAAELARQEKQAPQLPAAPTAQPKRQAEALTEEDARRILAQAREYIAEQTGGRAVAPRQSRTPLGVRRVYLRPVGR